jgi:hypothetical protein
MPGTADLPPHQSKGCHGHFWPDGLYQARFVSIEEREGDKCPYLIWHFEAFPEEGMPVEVSGISSTKFTTQAKGRQWLDALLSELLESGEEVDFDSLKNKACQLYVLTATTAKGATVSRIDRVIPANLKVQKSKSTAKPKDEDGEAMDDDDVPF